MTIRGISDDQDDELEDNNNINQNKQNINNNDVNVKIDKIIKLIISNRILIKINFQDLLMAIIIMKPSN